MHQCTGCGTYFDENFVTIKSKPSELHSIVPARMPERSNAEALAGDSSVPGDSRVKVSDEFGWLDDATDLEKVYAGEIRPLLAEVRRLEQIIQDANG